MLHVEPNMTILTAQTVPTKRLQNPIAENRKSIPMSFKLGLTWKYAHLAFANVKYRIRLAGIVRRFVCTYVLVCVVEVQQCTEALVLPPPLPPSLQTGAYPWWMALTY